MQEMTIYLEDGRRIKELEARIAKLEAENLRLTADNRTLDFRYRCECTVNMELIDLCREKGVKYRPSLVARPWEGGVPIPPARAE